MLNPRASLPLFVVVSLWLLPVLMLGQASVLTQRNDLARTGLNNAETSLTPTNVNPNSFGKLYTLSVDGNVYAQPLFVSSVTVNGAVHDVLLVATEHDTLYAFDSGGSQLWQRSLLVGPSGATVTSVPATDVYTAKVVDLGPEIGVTGTPVIDPNTNTLYVVAATKEVSASGTTYVQRLHKIDITSGADLANVAIAGSVAGTASDAVNGRVAFDPRMHLQRTGLALVNGNVYMGFGSHNDLTPYHGWVFGYVAGTLAQSSVFCSTPDGEGGGIWEAGGGLSADPAGNLYVTTGNGYNDLPSASARNFGESVIKLTPGLSAASSFSPYNQITLSNNDQDLGVNSPLILPTQPGTYPNELVMQGKTNTLYVLDRDALGGYNTTANHDIQDFAANNGFATAFGFFGNTVYLGSPNSPLQAFTVSNGAFVTSPTSASANNFPFPAPSPSISSNGTANGIVWAISYQGYSLGNGASSSSPAVLYAYDASNLGSTLYSSSQAANNRDQGPLAVKFTAPTVANGRVFVGGQNAVTAYGLLSSPTAQTVPTPTFSPAPGNYGKPQNVSISTSLAGATIYYTTNGSTPTTSSSVYSGPLHVTSGTTISALAVKSGYANSAVASAAYKIKGH